MTPQRQHEALVGARFSASPPGRTSPARAIFIPALALLACALVAPSVFGDCKCSSVKEEETTHWGGNEVVTEIENQSHRQVHGTVENPYLKPVEGALVEIFDHPDYLLDQNAPYTRTHPEQKRVAACRTPRDGKFCFPNLPPGKYELRSSVGSGWDVTHIYVVVEKKGQTKKIQVRMTLGT
jgi:protocatechuate 3,4-dioxygenase beta subunit